MKPIFHLPRRRLLTSGTASALCLLTPGISRAIPQSPAQQKVWTFDRLDIIGGLVPHIEGHPSVIDTPFGRAIEFNGIDDALFLDEHPLAGASTFTFEAIFRPDGGAFAQRWFHLASDEAAPLPGAKALNTRFLFEIRVPDRSWYLDAFTTGEGYKQTLAFPDKLHPLGTWHHVAQSFDGVTYRSYVNGILQGEAALNFKPQGQGHASVGVRMTRQDYFHGALRQARFTYEALPPEQFLKL